MTRTKVNSKRNVVAPEAIILSKNPTTGSYEEVKEYDGNVYLKDGQTFAIRLFNTNFISVAARIKLNGEIIGDLLVKPGQKVDLERYFNESRKFIFETYNVEDSDPKVREAIKNNGKVEIEFFEEDNGFDQWFDGQIEEYNRYDNNIRLNDQFERLNDFKRWDQDINYDQTDKNSSYYNRESIGNNRYTLRGMDHTGDESMNVNYDSSLITDTSIGQTTFGDSTLGMMETSSTEEDTRSMRETGRIGKGGNSSQRFEKVDMKFKDTSFFVKKVQILPVSMKKEQTDVRFYCPNCGYRIRKRSWIFCPKCGNNLEF